MMEEELSFLMLSHKNLLRQRFLERDDLWLIILERRDLMQY